MNQRTFIFFNKILGEAFTSNQVKFGISNLWKLAESRGTREINTCSTNVKFLVMRSSLNDSLPTFPPIIHFLEQNILNICIRQFQSRFLGHFQRIKRICELGSVLSFSWDEEMHFPGSYLFWSFVPQLLDVLHP